MKRFVLILSVFALLGFLAGCEKPAAVVNGKKITKKELQKVLEQKTHGFTLRGQTFDKKVLEKEAIDYLIVERLILEEAGKRNIVVAPEEIENEYARIVSLTGKAALEKELAATKTSQEELRDDIKVALLLQKLVAASTPPVTDEEVQAVYNSSRGKHIKPESVNVRFIQTPSKEEGERIMEEIKESKLDFDQAADKIEMEKKAIVSRYNSVSTNFFPPEMKLAVSRLKMGAYGGPYKGTGGYYIIRIKEKTPERVMSPEEAMKDIRGQIEARRKQEALPALISELKQKAKIKVNL